MSVISFSLRRNDLPQLIPPLGYHQRIQAQMSDCEQHIPFYMVSLRSWSTSLQYHVDSSLQTPYSPPISLLVSFCLCSDCALRRLAEFGMAHIESFYEVRRAIGLISSIELRQRLRREDWDKKEAMRFVCVPQVQYELETLAHFKRPATSGWRTAPW
jgi:hypothetical protein